MQKVFHHRGFTYTLYKRKHYWYALITDISGHIFEVYLPCKKSRKAKIIAEAMIIAIKIYEKAIDLDSPEKMAFTTADTELKKLALTMPKTAEFIEGLANETRVIQSADGSMKRLVLEDSVK